MKVIETTVMVDEMGAFTVQLPNDIAPGNYHAVIVIDDAVVTTPANVSTDGKTNANHD
jgi:hypothetical protein